MNRAFYLQLFHTKMDSWELRYSADDTHYCLLFRITLDQALEMRDDGWPITEEK